MHAIPLIEDAAHAHGSTFDGRFAGSFGAAAAFSFYPTKVVTSGEGGMILTTSADLAAEARIYRDQGKGSFGANHHVRRGYAWRMSELHAAAGLVHLRRMEQFIDRRRAVAARYDAGLAELGFLQPARRAARLPEQLLQVRRAAAPRGRPRLVQAAAGRKVTTSGWPARSTTCRCTCSRCSPQYAPGRACPSPRTSASATSACRSTRT